MPHRHPAVESLKTKTTGGAAEVRSKRMSDSPFDNKSLFGEQPKDNPYASPTAPVSQTTTTNPVLAPGIILLVLSGVFMMLLLASLPFQVINLRHFDTRTAEGMGALMGGITALISWFAVTTAILFGSICMIRMKGYKSALAAAGASSIPCCSPFYLLGIPFGIWAWILLMKPCVRARFR